MKSTMKFHLNALGIELFAPDGEPGLVAIPQLQVIADKSEVTNEGYELVLIDIDDDGEEARRVIGELDITEETLELELDAEYDDDGNETNPARPFRITVHYSGDHHDQDWNTMYGWVRDEWSGSDAVYEYGFISANGEGESDVSDYDIRAALGAASRRQTAE